jgi:hypothetical protein
MSGFVGCHPMRNERRVALSCESKPSYDRGRAQEDTGGIWPFCFCDGKGAWLQ